MKICLTMMKLTMKMYVQFMSVILLQFFGKEYEATSHTIFLLSSILLQIICATCGSKDLSTDNDIILCDGSCDRGFHQKCLSPPLLTHESKYL